MPITRLGPPGGRYIDNRKNEVYIGIIEEAVAKYDVDRQEILVGMSDIPPSDPTCLVYIQLTTNIVTEYFRKGMKSDGRWVCWNYLAEEITDNPSLKGTYDLRKGIRYLR